MKTLLLCILFACTSFISYGQLGFAGTGANRGKTVLTFKNGTREVGKIKEKFLVFGYHYDDPYEFKFKNDGAKDYRSVSSNDVVSVEIFDKKKENWSTVYHPIRVRKFDKKYTFSDKYFVDFYPLNTYKDIPYAKLLILDNGKLIFTHFYFPVANTDYFFFFHDAYRRTDREAAQFMMLMDKNCEAFQTYLQANYIDSKNYKEEYKKALAEFKAAKSEYIAERIAAGFPKKLAKLDYKSQERFVFFQQIFEKYKELCTHENHQ